MRLRLTFINAIFQDFNMFPILGAIKKSMQWEVSWFFNFKNLFLRPICLFTKITLYAFSHCNANFFLFLLCLLIYLSFYQSIYLYIYLSIYWSLNSRFIIVRSLPSPQTKTEHVTWIYLCFYNCISIYPSSINQLSIYLSIYLSIIYLSIYLSIHHLSIFQSTFLY